jgi:hypothetical protein
MLRFFHILVPVALSALCVAACGDDDDSPANNSGSAGVGGSGGGNAGGNAGGGNAGGGTAGGVNPATMTFFVTSKTNSGNLGGLAGADAQCESLAAAVGAGNKGWRAYLSVENDGSGQAVNARDRIGTGPWVNARGVQVGADADALHARTGDADVFLDESGKKINGQWLGSPAPNEHDVLTGSTAEGKVAVGATCSDWTSDSDAEGSKAQVGHTDGLGPMQDANPPRNSWQSAHPSRGCSVAALAMSGSVGHLYCFATQK